MGNFRSDDRGFGRGRSGGRSGGFGGGRFGGRGGRGDRGGRPSFRDDDRGFGRRKPFEKHEVTCDKCGKLTDVPFKPTTGKPIFCRECFGSSGSRTNSGSGSSEMSSEQFDKINAKLDKIIAFLDTVEIVEDEDLEEDDEAEEGEENSEAQ